MLIAWRSTGKVTMVELEELRLKLGIEPNEYKRMGQFKEKVLHLAIDQINKYTDIKQSMNNTNVVVQLLVFHLSLSRNNNRKIRF